MAGPEGPHKTLKGLIRLPFKEIPYSAPIYLFASSRGSRRGPWGGGQEDRGEVKGLGRLPLALWLLPGPPGLPSDSSVGSLELSQALHKRAYVMNYGVRQPSYRIAETFLSL